MKFLEDKVKDKIRAFVSVYKTELVLLSVSLTISLLSLALFTKAHFAVNNITIEHETEMTAPEKNAQGGKIYVQIVGAVEKPDVYELDEGARLKDLLALANGLSGEADRTFFYRNFNLAKVLQDQEKIYIPTAVEVEEGIVTKNSSVVSKILNNSQSGLINLNSATAKELDSLPGVGPVTAEKIIAGRPYNTVEDILIKKVVGKSVFEKIKDKVTAP